MNEQTVQKLKTISPGDLATLGLHQLVYVRRQVLNDQPFWSIHAADGSEMARLADRETAIAACRQHDLEPVSIH
ncbi:MAG: DUF1150 family protein [Alphaproteobacteria bacterium]|nr:DUF1150 family protein [Alphaproteobacteria bacterium]